MEDKTNSTSENFPQNYRNFSPVQSFYSKNVSMKRGLTVYNIGISVVQCYFFY